MTTDKNGHIDINCCISQPSVVNWFQGYIRDRFIRKGGNFIWKREHRVHGVYS
jgi:hypothetical protein